MQDIISFTPVFPKGKTTLNTVEMFVIFFKKIHSEMIECSLDYNEHD